MLLGRNLSKCFNQGLVVDTGIVQKGAHEFRYLLSLVTERGQQLLRRISRLLHQDGSFCRRGLHGIERCRSSEMKTAIPSRIGPR